MQRTARCGKCKDILDYPLFKVPLGPPTFDDVDGTAAAAGLDIKYGVVLYSWFCLPCTHEYVDDLHADDLRGN